MPTKKRKLPGPDYAPFRNGSLLNWVSVVSVRDRSTSSSGRYSGLCPEEWRENKPFEDALVLHTMSRGQSAARFIWINAAGNEFPMFMSDALDLMMDPRGVSGAVAAGWWVVVKRGQNYGIKRLDPGFRPTLAAR